MSDLKKYALDDRLISMVSGGYLPEGWQDCVKDSIINFLKMSDEELSSYGCTRNAESLIATMDEDFRIQEGLTDDELQQVRDYIRSNYESLSASIR